MMNFMYAKISPFFTTTIYLLLHIKSKRNNIFSIDNWHILMLQKVDDIIGDVGDDDL